MPANTPKGYPYPLGTDRLMDGDDAIHNLAQAVDDHLGRVAAGQATVAVSTANTPASVAVTFPVGRFTATPYIVTQYNGTLAGRSASSSAASTAGATVWGNAPTTGNVAVGWVAVQV